MKKGRTVKMAFDMMTKMGRGKAFGRMETLLGMRPLLGIPRRCLLHYWHCPWHMSCHGTLGILIIA
jgi:hypothetical protein